MPTPMHMLVTAGPTYEAIDAVRFIGNRSSGRMGIAIANAAAARGHDVTLLLGPVESPINSGSGSSFAAAPAVMLIERFRTADDLRRLLIAHYPGTDAFVMAAAVADFRPRAPREGHKIERGGPLTIELEPVPDLLAETDSWTQTRMAPPLRIGFALEERARLDERAVAKLARKSLDAIVANPLETMDDPNIEAQLFVSDGTLQRPPSWPAPIPKEECAAWLVVRLEDLAARRGARPHAR